jgi:hypothetical protein
VLALLSVSSPRAIRISFSYSAVTRPVVPAEIRLTAFREIEKVALHDNN